MSIEMVLYLINLIGNLEIIISLMMLASIISTITLLLTRWHTYGEWLDVFSYLGSKYSDESDERREKRHRQSHERFIKYSRWSICCMVPLIIIFLVLPSQSTIYMMLASNVAKKSEIPEKVLKAIEMKLDEYIDGVAKKVKN